MRNVTLSLHWSCFHWFMPLKARTLHCPKYNSRNLTYTFLYKIFLKCRPATALYLLLTEERMLSVSKLEGKLAVLELLRNTVSLFEVTTS